MLHLKDCVLAEVDEALHLLLVAAVADGGVEEGLLGLLDLRLLPLVQLVLVDLKVHTLNLKIDEHGKVSKRPTLSAVLIAILPKKDSK